MKILVLSDTHGKIAKATAVYNKMTDVDFIFHCGDYEKDALLLQEQLGVPVLAVKGNCDGCHSVKHQIFSSPAGDILITHGHMEGAGVNSGLLLQVAKDNDCKAICFGHTHVPMCENFDGTWLINPGSLTQPRDNTGGSYAVINCTETDFHASIVYYDHVFPQSSKPPAKKKVRGGFLRDLLNYSDRF